MQIAGGDAHLGDGAWFGAAEQNTGFWKIGRDDFGERQEFAAQRVDGVRLQQVVPAFRYHHGIDDEAFDAVAT